MAYYFWVAYLTFKERNNFTNYGFIKNAKSFTTFDDVDVSGWKFLVIGGSTGIGLAVALNLVKRKGTNVFIVCKSKANGEAALEFLKNDAHPESTVRLYLVDLSEAKEIFSFVKRFTREGGGLNVLINNAGIRPIRPTRAENGFERSFALNVVGTYLLTKKLIRFMVVKNKSGSKPRVIFVSSGSMLTTNLNTGVLWAEFPFDGAPIYAQQKRQQVVFCDILAEKYPDIQFSSMHPGWVDTPGLKHSLYLFYNRYKDDLRSPDQGADTIVWLSVSNEALDYKSGTFFFDRAPAKKFLFSSSDCYDKAMETEYITNLQKIVSTLRP